MKTSPRSARIRFVQALGFLAVLLWCGGTIWVLIAADREKPFGYRSKFQKSFQAGVYWKGELWFPVTEVTTSYRRTGLGSMHIHRLNPETGKERATELSVATTAWTGIDRMGDKLLLNGNLYELQGDDLKLVGRSTTHPSPVSNLFEFRGQPSLVIPATEGGYRLVHLVDGVWQDGRKIVLPGADLSWESDPETGRRRMRPRSVAQPVTGWATVGFDFQVVANGDEIHLLFEGNNRTVITYRAGFEFEDDDQEADSNDVSALAPANAPREASGWEDPFNGLNDAGMAVLHHDGVAPLVLSRQRYLVVRRIGPDEYLDLQIYLSMMESGAPLILAHPTEERAFVAWVAGDVCLNGAHRIEGNSLFALPHYPAGSSENYSAWFGRLQSRLIGVWLLHVAVLVLGAACLMRRYSSRTFEFGNQVAALAPLWRRVVARVIDVTLLGFMVGLVVLPAIIARLPELGEWWRQGRTPVAMYLVMDFEQRFGRMPFASMWPQLSSNLIVWLKQSLGLDLFHLTHGHFVALLLIVLVVWGIKVAFEGIVGCSPGQWLCGLRTVRTTLRPCGIARVALRDLLLLIDIPFLLTPLPAACSLALSDHRQRIADRLADTIVVEACRPLKSEARRS